MAREAKENASADQKRKDAIEAKNRIDGLIYSVEKTLKDHRDKVSPEEAKAVEEALEEAKKARDEGAVEAINTATDKLTSASHKLAEVMYKASQTPPTGASAADGAGSGAADGAQAEDGKKDDVVDAEFVDVEDKK
jgi:molecular chaperone DnaK